MRVQFFILILLAIFLSLNPTATRFLENQDNLNQSLQRKVASEEITTFSRDEIEKRLEPLIARAIETGVKEEALPFSLIHADANRDRPIFLLVHGFAESSSGMRPLANHLYESGSNVVALTLTGHGSQPEKLHSVKNQVWKDDVKTALNLLSSTGQNIFIAGYSLGGGLSYQAMLDNPKLIKGGLLISPAVGPSTKAEEMVEYLKKKEGDWVSSKEGTNPFAYPYSSKKGFFEAVAISSETKGLIEAGYFPGQPIRIISAADDPLIDVSVVNRLTKAFPAKSHFIFPGDSHFDGIRPPSFQMIGSAASDVIMASGTVLPPPAIPIKTNNVGNCVTNSLESLLHGGL